MSQKLPLKERVKIWFWPANVTSDEYKSELERDKVETPLKDREGGQMDDSAGEQSNSKIDNRVSKNTEMTHENRHRIIRIDERTAFIAKIIFALFIAFVVAVGAGMFLAVFTP